MGTFFETIGVVVTIVMPWVALAVAIAARQEAAETDEAIDCLIVRAEDADSRIYTHSAFITDILERLAAVEAEPAGATQAKH